MQWFHFTQLSLKHAGLIAAVALGLALTATGQFAAPELPAFVLFGERVASAADSLCSNAVTSMERLGSVDKLMQCALPHVCTWCKL